MLEELENNRNMEAEERQKLEDEIAAKQAEIDDVRDEVNKREDEAVRMQEEMAETMRSAQVNRNKSTIILEFT